MNKEKGRSLYEYESMREYTEREVLPWFDRRYRELFEEYKELLNIRRELEERTNKNRKDYVKFKDELDMRINIRLEALSLIEKVSNHAQEEINSQRRINTQLNLEDKTDSEEN